MNQSILYKFPKKRAELPEEYQKIYDVHYQKNRDGGTKATSLSMRMESWLHKKVAEDVKVISKKTLEIGAGTLNQLDYEPKVEHYDVVEPFKKLYESSNQLSRVNNRYDDILDIDDAEKYDRITSVATFEHILDLPTVVAKAALLLDKGASLRASIPNEGTILWRMGTMITGAEFKKMYGLDYQVLMRYEHVNTAKEIEEVLRYFFKHTKVQVYGLCKKLAFYVFISCDEPDRDKAKAYLESQKNRTH